jgi:hypothetical protein
MKRSAVFGLVAGLLACGGKGGGTEQAAAPPAAPAQEAKPAAPPAAAVEKPAAPAALSNRVDDPSFELVAAASGPYAAGKLASFAISLTPRGVYHVNQEFPIGISLHPDEGLSLPKSELAKADAATFGEKAARFDVPFTAQKAGEHRVEAKVRFAVCTPENCVPDERTLALSLPVQ